jgi:disulfide bond formation protein DsbB
VSTETAEVFFALLTLVADVAVVVLVAARLSAGRWPAAAAVVDACGEAALPLALAVAATCMAGSLYFSEVADFVPCTLCWYQRIAMYPLVLILAVAAVLRDRAVRRYVVPLAAVGMVTSLYHYLVEWFPEAESGVCRAEQPCSLVWFRELGFITLPFMALSGFALIVSLVTLRPRESP